MRALPFIAASESPRPFSEVKAERGDVDLEVGVLRQVAELEAEARAAEDPREAQRLQCLAEDLRCALHETKAGRA